MITGLQRAVWSHLRPRIERSELHRQGHNDDRAQCRNIGIPFNRDHTILYYTVLYYTILDYTILYYTVL